MQRDAQDFAKKSQECQRRGDEIYTSHQSLHPTVASYPFHSWGLDFVGLINPSSEGCAWKLVATELFTKWVEVVAMKNVTSSSVANFLRENIICCFRVTDKIISDNGTLFLNKDVSRLTEWYSISHTTSTPYYPKENGQAEVSNKRLLKILGKMTKENENGWKEELPITFWAHRIDKSQAARASSFSLVYGIEAVIRIDLVRPVVKLAEIAGIPREDTLEVMEEMCDNFASHKHLHQANIKAKHEGQVRERKF